jgi:ribonuclease BN (tRNA processing enzyme)
LESLCGQAEPPPAAASFAIDLGKLAAKVNPGIPVLYHVLPFGGPQSEILDEINQNFKAKIIYANDLDVIR